MTDLPENWFQQLKDAYPKRSKGDAYNWPDAQNTIVKHLKTFTFEQILEGTKCFCAAAKLCGKYGTEFIPMASTFYNRRGFLDEYETEEAEVVYRRPAEVSQAQKARDDRTAVERMAELRGEG